MRGHEIWTILKQTANDWMDDKAPRLGAALAFYSVLSLAPLLVIILAIAGAFFGEEAARGEIVDQFRGMVGVRGAEAIEDLIVHSQHREDGILAATLGAITLLFGASGVFGELQDSLNTIWDVKPKPGRGIANMLRERFLSFAMVLGTAFLLIVSLVINATLAGAAKYMSGFLDGYDGIWSLAETAVSFGIITVLFALIFKMVPDVQIGWKDTWLGATVTALLFTLGKTVLGLYLGRSGIASTYGAAGSLVVLVIWIYYSAQILYFGAELTQAWTHHFRKRVPPTENAESTLPESSPSRPRAEASRMARKVTPSPDTDSNIDLAWFS